MIFSSPVDDILVAMKAKDNTISIGHSVDRDEISRACKYIEKERMCFFIPYSAITKFKKYDTNHNA